MSRAWQAERAAEREQEALDQDYANGRLTDAEYREASRQIECDLRDAYQADLEEAQQHVRDEWGSW